MYNTGYSSLLLTFLSESPRKFAIFGLRRKILARKHATFHIHKRCLQLRKPLKRKQYGIEKHLIFDKFYAEFLTRNLNLASFGIATQTEL